MKKIYSLLTLFVASLLSLAAQAETRTVTFHVDDASHLQPLEMYGSDATIAFGDDNTAQVTFGEEYGMRQVNIYAADGSKITSIKKADGSDFKSSYTLYPTPSSTYPATEVEFKGYDSYDGFYIEDGDVINIETIEVESKIFTFKANPEHIKYAYVSGKYIYMDETGVLAINVTDVYRMYIYFNDDSIYKSTTNEAGEEQDFTYSSANNYIEIKSGDFEGDQTFTIVTASKADLRTASLNVKIENGKASDVDFYRGGKSMTLDGEETVVMFDPENEADFKVGRNPWSKKLFKVELDGEPVEYSGYYINFKPQDGSNLVITVDAPAQPVPVKFEFTNEGTEGVLSRLSCDGVYYSAEECLFEGFSLNYGSTFYLELNEDKYSVEEVLYNGQDGYKGVIDVEDEYVVTITATKRPMQTVTFKCEAWENVVLQDDYRHAIKLTGPETVYEAITLPEYFEIGAINGYVLYSVTDEATGNDLLEVDYVKMIKNFSPGSTIVIDAREFVRDQELVVFLEDFEWENSDLYLSSYTDNETLVTLEPGYTHIAFGMGDFTKDSPYIDPNYVMYLNDELVEMETYYGWSCPVGLEKIKDGDVLKIFSEEKTPHQVTYEVAEDVNADIFHDHVVAISEPATHAVLPGTEIHIKPAAAKTRSAASGLIVKVNDETVEPAEDGMYTITVDGDKTISVVTDPSVGIAEISAEGAAKAYDLMGRRVNANHRGLTIVNGKKVMK